MENEEKEIDLMKLLKLLWDNKWKLIKFGALGFCAGVIIAFSIPKEYNTTVKMTPEGSSTSSSMGGMSALAGMAGINLNSGVDGITSMIYPDIVKSTPFLLEFVDIEVECDGEKMSFYHYTTEEQKQAWWGTIISAPMKFVGLVIGLFSGDKKEGNAELNIFKPSLQQKRYISFLHENIGVSTDKKTNILTIVVTTQDALISAIIADSLLSKLQIYMTDYKTSKIRKDLAVKQSMLDDAKQNYYNAEERLAEGLDYNRNITSEKGKVKINRLTNEMDLAFNVYQQLAQQVELTKIQLQNETPIVTIIEPSSVATRATSPNKPLIAIMWAFLGGAGMAGLILYKNKFFSSETLD